MKKSLLALVAITTLFFGACKKDSNKPGDSNNNGGGGDTYQPFTTGSVWKYRSTFLGGEAPELDTTISTMTDKTKTFENKKFHIVNSTDGTENYEEYLGLNDHVYSTYMYDAGLGESIEFAYLNDSKAKGDSWVVAKTYETEEGNIDAQIKTTIVEKGINKTILDKQYSNVIQTKVEVQYKVQNNWVTLTSIDFYAAKGVGVIGIYSSIQGELTFKSELFNYTIK
ncbi:hypothetical protein GCM10023149_42350 [Mucilaginibacter gynuensis]|uniref:Lipoprotein n=1 Tax=Mucilaginibacter gynuensis TaxID=1302236 RepID=A0ABP8H5U1_9SPHI